MASVTVGGLPEPEKGDRMKLKVELVPRREGGKLVWAVDEGETRTMPPDVVRAQEERRRILTKSKPTKAELRRATQIERETGGRYSEFCATGRTEAQAMALICKVAGQTSKKKDADAAMVPRIIQAVSSGYDERGVADWFGRPRTQLGGRTPARAILDGDAEKVLELASTLEGPGGAT